MLERLDKVIKKFEKITPDKKDSHLLKMKQLKAKIECEIREATKNAELEILEKYSNQIKNYEYTTEIRIQQSKLHHLQHLQGSISSRYKQFLENPNETTKNSLRNFTVRHNELINQIL